MKGDGPPLGEERERVLDLLDSQREFPGDNLFDIHDIRCFTVLNGWTSRTA